MPDTFEEIPLTSAQQTRLQSLSQARAQFTEKAQLTEQSMQMVLATILECAGVTDAKASYQVSPQGDKLILQKQA